MFYIFSILRTPVPLPSHTPAKGGILLPHGTGRSKYVLMNKAIGVLEVIRTSYLPFPRKLRLGYP